MTKFSQSKFRSFLVKIKTILTTPITFDFFSKSKSDKNKKDRTFSFSRFIVNKIKSKGIDQFSPKNGFFLNPKIKKIKSLLETGLSRVKCGNLWQMQGVLVIFFKSNFKKHAKVLAKISVIILALAILIIQIIPSPVRAGYSFQTNFNSGSYDAFNSLGSPTASTDTDLPSLNPAGYEGNNSLEYAYDGTSTLKYETASNLSPDKGSIELKMQKGAYGNNVDYDAGGFYQPASLDYDAATGSIYIADRLNDRIVKTNISGSVWQTFGNSGSGVGQLNDPAAVKYDSASGFLYIFDCTNGRIVKSKMDGSGWAAWGTVGSGTNQFSNSGCSATAGWSNQNARRGIDYDAASGYIYVADGGNNRVIKTQWGGTNWTVKTGFSTPLDVEYDVASDYLYVANLGANNIIKTKIDGTGWTALGSVGFSSNSGIDYDPTSDLGDGRGGLIYISDQVNHRIVKTRIDGSDWATYGSSGSGTNQFSYPQDVFYDAASNYMYIVEMSNHRITKTQFGGTGWTNYGSYYKNMMKFKNYSGGGYPGITGVAYDSASGFLYISDSSNHRIVKTKFDGTGWQTLGGLSSGSGTGQFNYPNAIAYDSASGFLYITDKGNSRIVKTQIDGTGWTTWGTSGSGTGQFSSPKGIDYHNGYLYIADGGNNRIIKTQFGGTGWTALTGFSNPSGIFYDSNSAFIYVADTANNRVVKTQIDGTGWDAFGVVGTGDGQFNYPYDIKFDSVNNYIYVLDSANNRMIRTDWGASDWTQLTGFSFYYSSPGWINTYSRGFAFDHLSGYMYVGNFADSTAKVIRTKIDGSGWITTSDSWAKEKVLFSSQTTDDMRIVYDVLSRKIRFYLAYSNKAQFVETDTLSLTDGEWYKIKCAYNKANHTLSIYINDIEVATRTYDSDWGSLNYGTYFYVGARSGSTTDRWDGMIDDIYIDTQSIDVTPPTNPTPANTHFYSNSGKTTEFVSGEWGNSATPYITWSGASDLESGLKGYYLYLGTDNDAAPTTTSGVLTPNPGYSRLFQTHVGIDGAEQNITVPASALVSGITYYFRLCSQDNDLNLSDPITLFTYKYDGGTPEPPEFINVSPVGCSTAATFTFTWDAVTDPVSGIAGYQYKNGSAGAITDAGNVTTLDLAPYQEGDNIAYIRTRDNAGNVSLWQTAVYCSTGAAYILDGPTVTGAPSSLTVTWVSSKLTTSYVQVYKGNEYVSEQGHTDYSITHNVRVVGLDPETVYRYRVRWLDQSGNAGQSSWFQTATSAAPAVGNFEVEVISPSKVLISWDSSELVHAVLSYGIGSASTSVDIGGFSNSFSQTIDGLIGGTAYVVRIKSTTHDDYIFYSDYYSFSTPPIPEISSLRFEPLTNQSSVGMKVTWVTNVDTSSTVIYGPQGSGNMQEISKSDLVKDHEIQINDLSDNTIYELRARGTDSYGNIAESDTNSFITPMDTRPPKISNLIIETSNVGLNREDKAQIAVSWETDEPATSYVEYAEGLSGDQYTSKTVEDKTLTTKHLVIISELIPSKPYHLRVVSADKAKNIGRSADSTAITGEVPKSVLQIILKTLSNTFGWLSKFTGLGI